MPFSGNSRFISRAGFTLLELSIVLVLIALVTGGGLITLGNSISAGHTNVTNARMDAIEKAILDFSVINTRIPCPGSLTLKVSDTYYGVEAANNSATCVGGSPAATLTAVSGTVEGSVPTRALGLPDEYMYDGWGHRFRYAVDPSFTAGGALPFPKGGPCSNSSKAITVNDATGAARTTAGVYALISNGENGHGGYTSNGVASSTGSTNADELTNCHCHSDGTANTYTPTYIEKFALKDPTTPLNNFDDIVTFKEGWQIQTPNTSIASAPICSAIYVGDYNNYRVVKFDLNGHYLSTIGGYGMSAGQFAGNPLDLALDSAGNLWVLEAGNGYLDEFGSNGNFIKRLTLASTLFSLEYNATNGNLWLGLDWSNYAEEIDSNGTYIAYNTDTANYSWEGAATDSAGNYWVSNGGNGSIRKYDSTGAYVGVYGGAFYQNVGIGIDRSDNIWVGDTNGQVEVFNSSGAHYMTIGGSGTGDGQFQRPYRFAFDTSGNAYITDSYNARVQKFNSSGTFQFKFDGSDSGLAISGATGIAVKQ